MELLALFGIGFGTGLSGAMIPGPLFLYTVSEAFHKGQLVGVNPHTTPHALLRRAKHAGWPLGRTLRDTLDHSSPGALLRNAKHRGLSGVGVKIAVGHLLLEAAFVALVVTGLRGALSSALFRTSAAWIGGIGLVAMGGLILAQVRRLSLTQRADVSFRWGPFVGGAFFSLISPGFLLWWATIGASVFLQGAWLGIAGIAAVAAGHAMADLLWCWFVACSVERGRPYCTDRAYRAIMTFIALCLIALGISFPLQHVADRKLQSSRCMLRAASYKPEAWSG